MSLGNVIEQRNTTLAGSGLWFLVAARSRVHVPPAKAQELGQAQASRDGPQKPNPEPLPAGAGRCNG